MDSRVQRQKPYLAQEGSNMGHTQPNINQNWPYSALKQGLEGKRMVQLSHCSAVGVRACVSVAEAMQQMTLQPRDPQAGIETSVGLYPERPGESDCAYYSRTGFCRFGMDCRFNHPPKLKQVPQVEEKRHERVEQLECQFYKTGSCKFGAACKYSHSDDKTGSVGPVEFNFLGLPIRQGERECTYYIRTGSCKYGITCKYHHPEPATVGTAVTVASCATHVTAGFPSAAPSSSAAPYSPELPSCQLEGAPYVGGAHLQGPSAYVHAVYPPPQGMMPMPGWNPDYQGPVSKSTFSEEKQQSFANAATQPNGVAVSDGRASLSPSRPVSTPAIGHPAVQPQVAFSQGEAFPERPGELECQYFLKTGKCKFGAACRFHHPKVRVEESSSCGLNQMGLPSQPGSVSRSTFLEEKQCPVGMGLVNAATQPNNAVVNDGQAVPSPSGPLSSASVGHPAAQSQLSVSLKETFPERPGQPECQYFLKMGDCKFGAACRFHHPNERVEQSSRCMLSQMGLPIRPGQQTCVFYSRYGICKFGPMCKYDHPLTSLHNNPSVPMHCELNGAPYPRGGSNPSKHVQPSAPEISEKFSKIKDQV